MLHMGENMNSRHGSAPAADTNTDVESSIVVKSVGLRKSFASADGSLNVLNGVDLSIARGEMAAVVGESGAGKSTLLHILGGLDRATAGSLTVCGTDYASLSDDAMSRFRNKNIGFVFQFHHLMSDFTALENVMMPLLIRGDDQTSAREKASYLLDRLGLADRASHKPGKLSGGEQQRVAVGRALVTDPQLVLADEPSGNLDTKTAAALHDMLLELNRSMGVTFVVATHNREFAETADKTYELSGGLAVPVG